ncbi:MAG: dTDP-glucose 4,6-dehydratase [Candidatus Omnitrophota bacterium]
MVTLITGGAGFIGSAFVRLFAGKALKKVVIVDKLSYAGDLARLKVAEGRYKFYKADICDEGKIDSIFRRESPDIVLNFAAETHVDRSINSAKAFLESNILGVESLLKSSRKYKVKKFVHLSTDEVYGDTKSGSFSEESVFCPSSPYAASKAAGDLLIKSYIRTYDFPAIIIRPSNNYGPWQYPEKLIPRAILKLFQNKLIPIYAKGKNVREWLYVEDCARGILAILKKGRLGQVYNLGSGLELQNIAVIGLLLKIMRKDRNQFEFVKDRLGHDFRYSLNSAKIRREIGWQPQTTLEDGLRKTVAWAFAQRRWLESKAKEVEQLYKVT